MSKANWVETRMCHCKNLDCRFVDEKLKCPSISTGNKGTMLWKKNNKVSDDVMDEPSPVEIIIED